MSEGAILLTPSGTSSQNITSIPCTICRRQFSRYTCPKCNIPYCSLTCFRSESHAECSEAFYRKQVETDIQTTPSKTAEERKKMMEILKRFEEDAVEDEIAMEGDNLDDGLESRLQNLDLDRASYDDLWATLTPVERDKFLKALHDPSSDLAQQLLASEELEKERIEPWWEGQSDDEAENLGSPTGAIPMSSKRFGKRSQLMNIPKSMVTPLSTKAKGPSLLYNICAVLVAYAFVTRYLSASPISSLNPTSPEYKEARTTISRLVPFLVDRQSKVVLPSLLSIITDLWSRFDSGTMTPKLLSILLKDAAILLRTLQVTILPTTFPSNLTTPDLSTHPSINTLLALSDMSELFHSSTSSAHTNHISQKLTFYAARVLSTPMESLTALSDMLEVRSKAVEMEGFKPEGGPKRIIELEREDKGQNEGILGDGVGNKTATRPNRVVIEELS